MLWFILCYLFSIFLSNDDMVFIWRKDSVFFLKTTLQIQKTQFLANDISFIKEEFQLFQENLFYKRNISSFYYKFLL